MRFQTLNNKVIVITGASSGVGKLAVEAFLNEGAKVVLAARSELAMQDHLTKLQINRQQAIIVKTDISDFTEVQSLANKTLAHFGQIDIWINNAATNAVGLVDELPIEDIRRVIDVDLMGQIYGMKVALDFFLKQGYGNIINISSVEGVSSLPYQSAYIAAKHGMLGFSSALRQELMTKKYKDKKIDVIDILPPSIDTPFLNIHSKTYLGKAPKPIKPIYDPNTIVKYIVRHAKSPKPIVIVGAAGKLIVWMSKIMPITAEYLLAKRGASDQLTDYQKLPNDENNLYRLLPGTQFIRGGLNMIKSSAIRRLFTRKLIPLPAAATLLFLLWLVRHKKH